MNRTDRRRARRSAGRLVPVAVCFSGGGCCGLPTPSDLPAGLALLLGLADAGERTGGSPSTSAPQGPGTSHKPNGARRNGSDVGSNMPGL